MNISVFQLRKNMWVVLRFTLHGQKVVQLHYIVDLEECGCHSVFYDNQRSFDNYDLLSGYFYFDEKMNYDLTVVDNPKQGSDFLT